MKPILCFVCTAVTMIAILSLGCKPAPDKERPEVRITYPPGNATISDTITITATAWDNVGVVSVEFRLEFRGPGRGDTAKYPDIHYTDHLAPYEYVGFNTTKYDDGTFVRILAIARDSSNNVSHERRGGARIDNSRE